MSKLKNPRVVKVFFSSPFGGMEEEREELTRRYFPSLHHLCNSHGLQFAAVDMRWGITSESSDNAQVINICLKEIDRSDMFVGFFGQRYGWHGASDSTLQDNFNNAVGRYPWLDNFRDKSVTELEFLHGFLNNPGHLPATLYFRNKSYDDYQREEGQKKGDKKQVFKYSAESELSTELMDDLKRRVWEQRDKSLGVYMDYKTPAEAAKTMYTIILTYMQDVLLADLRLGSKSRREELLSQHDAFLASRCNIYVHGEQYLKLLDKNLMAERKQPVLVTGEAGSGKSALLCNWISALRQGDWSAYVIVYHFIGFADGSTDISSILSRLVEEFEHVCSSMVDGTSRSLLTEDLKQDTIDDIRGQMQRLLEVMDKLAGLGKTPVLVLDGLDKVTTTSKIQKVLFWLPSNFPSTCQVVVSSLSKDQATIEELKSRGYTLLEIQPLANDNKRDMCVKTLQESGKEMSPPQLDRIVAAEMTKIPLFLKVTLSELVSFGYFRLLDKKIDSLITSVSVEDLFLKVLERLEQDYTTEDYHGNLVEEVLCTLTLSHQGMSEPDLKELFDLQDQVWSPLYFAIEKLIVNQSGRIKFGFKELQEAIKKKYLMETDKRNGFLRKMIEYFSTKLEMIDHPGSSQISHHSVFELPWLWKELGDVQGLIECLSNYLVFSELQQHNIYDLVSLWQHTELSGKKITERLLLSFDVRVADLYNDLDERGLLQVSESPGLQLVDFLDQVNNFLIEIGFHNEREVPIRRKIKILTESLAAGVVQNHGIVEEKLFKARYSLACLYCQTYHRSKEGIKLHGELLAEKRQEHERQPSVSLLHDLGDLYHGMGVGYMYLKQSDKVMEVSEKAMECYQGCTGMNMQKEMATSWSIMGLAHMEKNMLDASLSYFNKCIEAYEEIYFGQLPPAVGEILTNKALVLRKTGDLDGAEQFYQRSLEVKMNALGRDHPFVAVCYLNLGALEMYRNNPDKALEYCKQAVDIYEALGHTFDEPAYVMSMENYLANMTTLLRYEEADEPFQKTLQWRVKDGSMDAGMPSLFLEMARYYLREHMYEKAYHTLHALLDSKHKTNLVQYALLDMAVSSLPQEIRQNLPLEMTIEYAVEQNPGELTLVRYLVEHYLVPATDVEEIARLVNRVHDQFDTTDQVYVHACTWCGEPPNEVCQQRIIEEGLSRYPDSMELLLDLAKSYNRQQQYKLAMPYLLRVVEKETDNFPLYFMVAMVAAQAMELETSRKYFQLVVDRCDDPQKVQQAKGNLTILEEELSKQEEPMSTTQTTENTEANTEN